MTHQENIQKIRDACIKANPEIVELKFGCRLFHPDYVKNAVINDEAGTGNGDIEKYFTDKGHCFYSDAQGTYADGTHVIRRNGKDEYWQVLGRPIRLADVLLAIDGISGRHWGVTSFSNFFALTVDRVYEKYVALWNLRKDSLEDQSEETVEFLASLLVPDRRED